MGHLYAACPADGKLPGNGFVKDEEGIEGHRDGKYWIPAECDVALRPGWFYHESQDGKAKSVAVLMSLYYKSVGRGACLDLGLSPDRRGLLNDGDEDTLKKFGERLKQTFAVNLAKDATLSASNVRGRSAGKFGPAHLLDNDRYSYWATDDTCKLPQLIVDLRQFKVFDIIQLRENIKLGQRIEAVAIDILENGNWKEVATATSIGANRLIHLTKPVNADKVRLRVTRSPVCIALSEFGLYKEAGNL